MTTPKADTEPKWLLNSHSSKMQQVYAELEEAAASDASVLITGENGTGKGVAVKLLHRLSPRRAGPLLTVDTTLFPRELLEAELFGVVPNFTFKGPGKDGLVHSAARGTLFFDEIGDMALELQPKLLRFVQEHRFHRVGATRDEPIDVRCVFATNCNLDAAIREGRFRQDLFYRIRDIRIRLPPLRERAEDIVPLARHFCARQAGKLGREVPLLKEELEQLLLGYDWPGNVRELEACIGELVHRCRDGSAIGPERLPADLQTAMKQRRPLVLAVPEGAAAAPAEPRPGPPIANEPTYQRVPRHTLVHQLLTQHLQPRRVVVLLQTHRGGGRSLARQLAPQSGLQDLWLVDSACDNSPAELFYRRLTRDALIHDQSGLDDWLRQQVRRGGPTLIVHTEPRGPEELLEEVAATLRGLQSEDSRVQFLIIGGERLLRLRNHERYSWLRLLPPSSLVDVPDLTVEEVARMLRGRGLPEQRAEILHQHTGGHPWLLYELLTKNIADPQSAIVEVKYQLRASRQLQRHLVDDEAREVLRRLVDQQKPVAPLGDPSVRRDPERYAESRLYFDGLLTVGPRGQTQLRCPAVRGLFEEDFLK